MEAMALAFVATPPVAEDVSTGLVVLGEPATGSAMNSATRATDDFSDHALQADTARSTYGIDGSVTSTGTVIRIGILSDSFNALGGAAADEADGDLPTAANVHIVADYSGGEDEGRAMADLVHRIAPGAQIYFYTGENGQAAFATGINTLQADGCQIIIDDLSYFAEPFYQADGTVQKAVDAVNSAGVTYFTSITNNGHDYYESTWSNIANFALPGVGTENVHGISNGSPYEAFTIVAYAAVTLDLQWAAPFASLGGAGDTFSIAMAIYDMTSGTPVLVTTLKPGSIGDDPTNINSFYNSSRDTSFAVVFYGYAGITPSGAFKAIFENTESANFTEVGSGTGSGATYGHNAAADADPTAAVYYGNTPANGGTLRNESFSSEGGTVLYYDAAGNKLATPITIANAAFSSTDGDTTSDPDISPFYGTSAAAPDAGAVAALILAEDGRLTNTQVSYLLGATATAFGTAVYSGDGLINADAAVAAAHVAVTNPIWTGQGSTNLWSANGNWSDNAAPTSSASVVIANGIGLLSGSYTVIDNVQSSAAASLQIDGTGASLYALQTVATPVLQIAASSALTVGSIVIGLGELDIFGQVVTTTLSIGSAAGSSDTYASGAAAKAVIEAGGFLDITTDTAAVRFAGSTGTLKLDSLPNGLTGAISGFSTGDRLDLSQLTYSAGDKAIVAGNLVSIVNGAGSTLASLTLSGSVSSLSLARDGSAGTLITVRPPPLDFAGADESDLLEQNTNGAAVIYTMNGLSVMSATSIGDAGSAWHIMGSADLNGDGQPDLLLQNDNGSLVDYLMNGTSIAAGYSLGNPGSSWHVRGLGDFNGDGNADILLENDNGSMVILETNGTNVIGSAALGTLPSGWAVEGVADFYGTGQPDVLVQSNTGILVLYTMSGTTINSGAVVGNPGAGYSVAGTGDYNGDGRADILLHNDDGVDVVWEMNGSTVTGSAFAGNPGASYTTAVTGIDLNGDGHSDLVVQNTTTSTMVGYTLNGSAAITAGAVLGTPGAGWNVVGSNSITFIDGTGSNLALTGTPGPDQFNLTSYAAGIHTISSFDPALDTLALGKAAFPSYAAVQANEAPYQGGTFINLSPTAAIVIQGVVPSQLTAANFVLR
jgi:hypothetical protein